MAITNKLSIAIIGAGPAGLMLARLLTQNSIPFTVFERDASASARTQGGCLDLHEPSGLRAIRAAGLYEEFVRYARFEGEALVIADKTGKRYLDQKAKGQEASIGRPEIDRGHLRHLLVESVPLDCIRWGHVLRTAGEDGILHFKSPEKQEGPFDLVVGADGAFSHVRPRVSKSVPFYSGVSGAELHFSNVSERNPAVSKLVGDGSFMVFSDRASIGAQRQINDGVRIHTWRNVPETWVKDMEPIHQQGGGAVKKALLEDFKDWCPEFQDWIRLADGEIFFRAVYMLPVGEKWEHRPGFTLIGDAAHLMTPFAGQGVNAALLDAVELAEALVRHRKSSGEIDLDIAVEEYEKSMFPRAEETARDTAENLDLLFFRPGAPLSLMEKLAKSMERAADKTEGAPAA